MTTRNRYQSIRTVSHKVLVVDDSRSACEHVVRALAEEPGVETTALTSGLAALQALQSGEFSLLICDYEMPNMNGLQLIRAVRSSRNVHDFPILVLTCRDSTRDKAVLLQSGANDYITKPVEPEELLARVRVQLQVLALHREILDAKIQVLQGQKLSAIGQLAAGVAHEINTPIQYLEHNARFIQSTVERMQKLVDAQNAVIRSFEDGESAVNALEEVVALRNDASFRRMTNELPRAFAESLEGLGEVSKIVEALSALAGPVNGRCPVDVNGCIETTLIATRNAWKGVAEVELALQKDLPCIVGDAGDLNQVFLALLLNAAHAIKSVVSPGEKGHIRIASFRSDDFVEVTVEDTGPGIPRSAAERIFEPFFTTKAVGEGRGQGLALARAAVTDRHGGAIEFETEEGKGTTFIVRLPLDVEAVRASSLPSRRSGSTTPRAPIS